MAKNKPGGQLLREWRGKSPQRDASEELGISVPMLCGYERGKRHPSLRMAIKFEDLAGVPVRSWL